MSSSAAFAELNRAFMFFSLRASLEGSEIPALAGTRVLFARIKAIFAGFQFPNHALQSLQTLRTSNCDAVKLHLEDSTCLPNPVESAKGKSLIERSFCTHDWD